MKDTMRNAVAGAVGALALGLAGTAGAVDISVGNYGTAFSAAPFAIAKEKGFFKEQGVDIDGIRVSPNGGGEVINMMEGGLPYADGSLPAVITAINQGADIKIISENVATVTDLHWVTMPNSPINSVKDLKGKRFGFSGPQSATQAYMLMILERAGYKLEDLTTLSTGGIGPGLTLLEHGGVDVVPYPEPEWTENPGKYKTVIAAVDALPPMNSGVGFTTTKVMREQPQLLRGIIAARRKAVEFMDSNRKEAADIIGRVYKVEPEVIGKIIERQFDHGSDNGEPFFSKGGFYMDSMDNTVHAMTLIGLFKEGVNWDKIIDKSFLPDDQKAIK